MNDQNKSSNMNTKTASNDFPIHPLLKERWSPRAFDNRFIEPDKIRSLFEAARWAPSSSNIQPWYFIVGLKGDDTYEHITRTLVEFNLLWATSAPMLFVAVAGKTGKKGEINVAAQYDLGQSVAHLTFQAMAEGLYVHQMGGFDPLLAKTLFDIPDTHEALTVVAVGYIGKPESLHKNLVASETAPRERRKAKDSVFSGKFNTPSSNF